MFSFSLVLLSPACIHVSSPSHIIWWVTTTLFCVGGIPSASGGGNTTISVEVSSVEPLCVSFCAVIKVTRSPFHFLDHCTVAWDSRLLEMTTIWDLTVSNFGLMAVVLTWRVQLCGHQLLHQLGRADQALLYSRTAHGQIVCQVTDDSIADDSGDIITCISDL